MASGQRSPRLELPERTLSSISRAQLGRAYRSERAAFAEDAHAGWWETSMMLMLRL